MTLPRWSPWPPCSARFATSVRTKHPDSYLQEFVYRFNRRGFEHELFEYVIGAAATASPLIYDQLTAERTG